MNDAQFQERCESQADNALALANALVLLNNETPNVGEAKRYLSLARTAAQESELWLGKAMVAFASGKAPV